MVCFSFAISFSILRYIPAKISSWKGFLQIVQLDRNSPCTPVHLICQIGRNTQRSKGLVPFGINSFFLFGTCNSSLEDRSRSTMAKLPIRKNHWPIHCQFTGGHCRGESQNSQIKDPRNSCLTPQCARQLVSLDWRY